jgi:hypothetical protein
MTHYICTTCGTQYAAQAQEPEQCKICLDDRQYVNWQGQTWTTLPQMQQQYRNQIQPVEPHIYQIQTTPRFAIGQKAYLIQMEAGNVLWDCVTLLDQETIEKINQLGGIAAIAISHPHYFATMVNWSQAFGDVPVYLHTLDQEWVMQPDSCIRFWESSTQKLLNHLHLIKCGGHFPGANVLYWPEGAEGKGVLFSGDTIQVAMDRQSVSFMYSYPNMIPLKKQSILEIQEAMANINIDRIYGAFEAHIQQDARQALNKSLTRYLQIYE